MQYPLLAFALAASAYAVPQAPAGLPSSGFPITIGPTAAPSGGLIGSNGTAISGGFLPSGVGLNGTVLPTGASGIVAPPGSTLTTTDAGSAPTITSAATSSSASPTGNAASMPTAALGFGFAGVAGIVGLLALARAAHSCSLKQRNVTQVYVSWSLRSSGQLQSMLGLQLPDAKDTNENKNFGSRLTERSDIIQGVSPFLGGSSDCMSSACQKPLCHSRKDKVRFVVLCYAAQILLTNRYLFDP
nr:hypothetical protein CFP56_32424 [Quercus suber]